MLTKLALAGRHSLTSRARCRNISVDRHLVWVICAGLHLKDVHVTLNRERSFSSSHVCLFADVFQDHTSTARSGNGCSTCCWRQLHALIVLACSKQDVIDQICAALLCAYPESKPHCLQQLCKHLICVQAVMISMPDVCCQASS